jgi:hypothetical protein
VICTRKTRCGKVWYERTKWKKEMLPFDQHKKKSYILRTFKSFVQYGKNTTAPIGGRRAVAVIFTFDNEWNFFEDNG